MLGRSSRIVLLGIALVAAGVSAAAASPANTFRVDGEANTQAETAAEETILYQHQDCVDAVAGEIGEQNHGSHTSKAFVPAPGGMTFELETLNLDPATCLPTAQADAPPRNAFVGHYNFKLVYVGDFDQFQDLRLDCTYRGVPTPGIQNFHCDGPGSYIANGPHVVEITINPQATFLGLPVSSEGAVELTFSQ